MAVGILLKTDFLCIHDEPIKYNALLKFKLPNCTKSSSTNNNIKMHFIGYCIINLTMKAAILYNEHLNNLPLLTL